MMIPWSDSTELPPARRWRWRLLAVVSGGDAGGGRGTMGSTARCAVQLVS